MSDLQFDVIVVGAGAADGVLAARIAEGGKRVLVLEAGQDPLDPKADPRTGRSLADDYKVPAFNAFASENEGMSEDIWVHHYGEKKRRARDTKYVAEKDAILYPRVRVWAAAPRITR